MSCLGERCGDSDGKFLGRSFRLPQPTCTPAPDVTAREGNHAPAIKNASPIPGSFVPFLAQQAKAIVLCKLRMYVHVTTVTCREPTPVGASTMISSDHPAGLTGNTYLAKYVRSICWICQLMSIQRIPLFHGFRQSNAHEPGLRLLP